MPLDCIGPEDVAAWFDAASRDRPGAANRALEILRAMVNRTEEWGLREHGSNPCFGIAKNPRKLLAGARLDEVEENVPRLEYPGVVEVARFLDMDALARLGRAFDTHEARWPEAVAAIRLLALTGCRRSEVLNLRWLDIGEDAIALEDSKTGPRAVPLGEAARALIKALPGPRDPDAFQHPRHAEGRGVWVLTNFWRTVCADAMLGRLHLQTSGTQRPASPSWRARTCRWSARRSGTGDTGPRQATPILTMPTLSKQRKKPGALSLRQ